MQTPFRAGPDGRRPRYAIARAGPIEQSPSRPDRPQPRLRKSKARSATRASATASSTARGSASAARRIRQRQQGPVRARERLRPSTGVAEQRRATSVGRQSFVGLENDLWPRDPGPPVFPAFDALDPFDATGNADRSAGLLIRRRRGQARLRDALRQHDQGPPGETRRLRARGRLLVRQARAEPTRPRARRATAMASRCSTPTARSLAPGHADRAARRQRRQGAHRRLRPVLRLRHREALFRLVAGQARQRGQRQGAQLGPQRGDPPRSGEHAGDQLRRPRRIRRRREQRTPAAGRPITCTRCPSAPRCTPATRSSTTRSAPTTRSAT